MEIWEEKILNERLEHFDRQFDRWKADLIKRLEVLKNAGETPLNDLIGKYYKAKGTRACMMIVKVVNWIPNTENFTLFVNRITITFPTDTMHAYVNCAAEEYEYVVGKTPEDAVRDFLEKFEEITAEEYNEYKKKANQIITNNF